MARNDNNLVPNSERTPEELREITSKGGKASGESRRRKKDFRIIAEQLLDMKVKKGMAANLDAITSLPELKNKNISVAEAMIIAVTQNAMKGDIQSINFIRDITGQKPKEELEVKATLNEGKLGSILKQLEEAEDKQVGR